MELQIKDLVDSIRKEGIDSAKQEASKIIEEAQQKAKSIVEDAKAQADKIFQDEKKEIEILRSSAAVNAQQARRDAVLSFKTEVQNIYKSILANEIKKSLDKKALSALIAAAVKDEDVSKLSVEVKTVSDDLKAELASQIKAGLEIRPVKDVDAGFRLCAKDGSGFFDCTDEEIAAMLTPFFGELSI